jgi:hypothetical protein
MILNDLVVCTLLRVLESDLFFFTKGCISHFAFVPLMESTNYVIWLVGFLASCVTDGIFEERTKLYQMRLFYFEYHLLRTLVLADLILFKVNLHVKGFNLF